MVYATAHRIRIEALSMMNDAPMSPREIAEALDEDLDRVSHHIRSLFGDGSIELVKEEKRGNTIEHIYRAVKLALVTSEEYQAMEPIERREVAALIVQAITAEALASLQRGKMETEREPWLTWVAGQVDEQAEEELWELAQETHKKAKDIEGDCINRLANVHAKAKEEGREPPRLSSTRVFALMAFERSRAGRPNLGHPR